MRFIRSGARPQSPDHEKAWLITTARNICKDALKSHKRRNEPLSEYMLTGEEPSTIAFPLMELIDYTDVEAILFCNEEFPITQRGFGFPEGFLS